MFKSILCLLPILLSASSALARHNARLSCSPDESLPAPSNFRVANKSNAGLLLSWDAVPQAASYRIQSTVESSTQTSAWFNTSQTSLLVADWDANQSYEFRLWAIDGLGRVGEPASLSVSDGIVIEIIAQGRPAPVSPSLTTKTGCECEWLSWYSGASYDFMARNTIGEYENYKLYMNEETHKIHFAQLVASAWSISNESDVYPDPTVGAQFAKIRKSGEHVLNVHITQEGNSIQLCSEHINGNYTIFRDCGYEEGPQIRERTDDYDTVQKAFIRAENPFSEQLVINNLPDETPVALQLIQANGRIAVATQSQSPQHIMATGQLQAGLYFLRVSVGPKVYTYKLIKI